MTSARSRRRIALLLLAAAALAALAGTGAERPAAAPERPAAAATEPAEGPADPGTQRAAVAGLAEPGRAFQVEPLPEALDAFRPRSWQPPAPAPRPAPVAKPNAPPLPFTYLGRIEEDGATTVYLRRGEDVVLAQPDKAIDSTYRLEEVAADRLVFTFVPLQQQQVLSLGAAR